MRLIDGEYWFEYEELAVAGVNRKAVNKAVERGSKAWQTMRHPEDQRLTLVRYSTMPEKVKQKVQDLLLKGLEPEEAQAVEAAAEEFTDVFGLTEAVKEGYKGFLRYYREYESDNRKWRTLARSAAIVKTLGDWSIAHGWKPYDPYRAACESMENWLAEKMADGRRRGTGEVYLYAKYLPTNPIRLKEKVQGIFSGEFAPDNKTIAAEIQPPRTGEKASYKGKFQQDDELIGHYIRLVTSGRGIPEQGMIRTIQRWCMVTGRPVPSESWFRQAHSDHHGKFLTADKRWDSGNKYRQRYQFHVPMSKPMHAGEVWSVDGTRFNVVPFLNNPDRLSDGRSYLYLVAVHDAMSGAFVGYHFDTTEDGTAVLSALRMAVEVHGYLPSEIRFDRFPGHDSLKFKDFKAKLEGYGVKVTITHAAQGKPIERAFGTLQTVFMSLNKYYYGEGIRSTRAYAHATTTTLKRAMDTVKKQGMGFKEMWLEALQVMEAYNMTPISDYSRYQIDLSPSQLHDQSRDEKENPCPIRIDHFQQMSLFEVGRLYKVRQGDLLSIISKKTEYLYELDYEIHAHYGEVYVSYDEADMDQVYLFHPRNRQPLGVAKKLDRITTTGPNADFAPLARRKAKIAADQARKEAELDALIAPVREELEVEILLKGHAPKGLTESAETAYLLRNEAEVTAAPKTKVKRNLKKAEEPVVVSQSNHWFYGEHN